LCDQRIPTFSKREDLQVGVSKFDGKLEGHFRVVLHGSKIEPMH